MFLVSGYLEGTFDKGSFGFRDKRILTFDREKIDRLEVAAGAAKTTVARQSDTWSVVAPANAQAGFGVIEAVLSQLANGQMKSIASGSGRLGQTGDARAASRLARRGGPGPPQA